MPVTLILSIVLVFIGFSSIAIIKRKNTPYEKKIEYILFGSLLLLALLTLIFAYSLKYYVFRALAILCIILSMALIFGSLKFKRRTLFGLSILIFIEVGLQIFGVLGLLPYLSFCSPIPYARVYWTQEGFGNSMTNRYGWHYPEFDTKDSKKRIVIIGDSFVEAVQVSRDNNFGYLLQQQFRKQEDQEKTSVLALGSSGKSPAFFYEILKYAKKHFDPHEAIIFVNVGDFIDSSYTLKKYPLNQYLYYKIGPGGISLRPECIEFQKQYSAALERRHKDLIYHLGSTLMSHFMIGNIFAECSRKISWQQQSTPQDHESDGNQVAQDLKKIGFSHNFFATDLPEEAKEAQKITLKILEQCHQWAQNNQITLRLVTVPILPKTFYDLNPQAGWQSEFEGYDFLAPEKVLKNFAQSKSIPILPMGQYFLDQKITTRDLKKMYFDGVGHFDIQGHQVFAQAIYNHFYNDN